MIGRMLDQHRAQGMEVVVIVVKNGDDDGNEGLKVDKKNKNNKLAKVD